MSLLTSSDGKRRSDVFDADRHLTTTSSMFLKRTTHRVGSQNDARRKRWKSFDKKMNRSSMSPLSWISWTSLNSLNLKINVEKHLSSFVISILPNGFVQGILTEEEGSVLLTSLYELVWVKCFSH